MSEKEEYAKGYLYSVFKHYITNRGELLFIVCLASKSENYDAMIRWGGGMMEQRNYNESIIHCEESRLSDDHTANTWAWSLC